METNLTANTPKPAGRKVDLEMVKMRLAEIKVKIIPAISDPKNRKIVILVAVLLAIILLLLVAGLVSRSRKTAKVTPLPTPTETLEPPVKPATLQDELNSIENELKNTSFEEKPYLPPEVDLDIKFKL